MSKQKELAKNTVILAVGKICTQFISFLLLPLYTTLLTSEEFGIIDLFNTYIALLVPIFTMQFDNGLFRFLLDCREDKGKQSSLFSTVIISNIMQSLIYILLYLIAQEFITSKYKIFLAIDVVLNIFLNTFLQFPRGRGDNLGYAIGSFTSAVMTVVMNVLFIVGFRLGAYGMFMATVLSKVVTILYLGVSQRTWKYFSLRLYDKSILKEIIKYSLPLVPNQLSWWIIGVSDRTIVSLSIGIAANGIYSVANKFSTLFATFYNIFNLSWTESVTLHFNESDRNKFLTEVINTMFRLFSATFIIIIAFMPLIFPILINYQYEEAYYHIPILMIAVLFQVIVGLYGVVYIALKKSTEVAKTTNFVAVINVFVDLILIKFIGLYAASLSTLISFFVMAVYRYFHVQKFVDIKLNKKNLCETILITMIILCSYYYNHMWSNICSSILATIFALVTNRFFLYSTLHFIIEKIRGFSPKSKRK